MSFQNNESSDMDFSIIDKKASEEAKMNFSVSSILQEAQSAFRDCINSQSVDRNNSQVASDSKHQESVPYVNAQNGSFLGDLQKLEEQLSFQTSPYDIYQSQAQTLQSNSLNPALNKSSLHAKSNSHLKTTKEESKNMEQYTMRSDDYGYLVLDFSHKVKNKKKVCLYGSERPAHLKLYTQQTKSSRTLKLSLSSSRPPQNISIASGSASKKKSLKKSLPNGFVAKRDQKNPKETTKSIRSKIKTPKKQVQQNSQKIFSKAPKSVYRAVSRQNNKSQVNFVETKNKLQKTFNFARQSTAYSEYYGTDQIENFKKLRKSDGQFFNQIQKNSLLLSPQSGSRLTKKSSQKSRCKNSCQSPSKSNKDLALRFKKKANNHLQEVC